jgi:hypothetical protein
MRGEFKPYHETLEWCEELSRNLPLKMVIERVIERLRVATDNWEIIALKEHLASEYVSDLDLLGARKELEDLILLKSGSAMSYSSLASHYLYAEENFEGALNSILKAEEASVKSGHFKRHVQAQKARIALAMNNYDLLGSTLRRITEIAVEPGQRDVSKERDFFDRADKSRLDQKVVAAFEGYMKQQR